MWVSAETVLGPLTASEDGILKQPRAPVLVLLEPVMKGAHLFCEWVFTHPGLVPGNYKLTNDLVVIIPASLCSGSGEANHSVTLEVIE